MVNKKLCILYIGTTFLIFGCGDKNDVIKPSGYVDKKIEVKNIEIPQINKSKTKKLFDEAGTISLGDKYGKFELRSEGILIHPGEVKSTIVNFNIENKYKNEKLYMFIAPLPSEAKDIKEAGTVELEIMLDGKSNGRIKVDRAMPSLLELDLSNTKILTVKVGNEDGKAWFDWLIIGVGE